MKPGLAAKKPGRPPEPEHCARRREDILDGAVKLFARHGYSDTDMQVLAGYRQPGTVEPHLDLGVGNSGRRRRHTRIGRQRHRHQWTPAIVRRLSVSAVRHGQGECRGDSYAARPAAAPAGAIRHDYFGCEHDALARRVIGA